MVKMEEKSVNEKMGTISRICRRCEPGRVAERTAPQATKSNPRPPGEEDNPDRLCLLSVLSVESGVGFFVVRSLPVSALGENRAETGRERSHSLTLAARMVGQCRDRQGAGSVSRVA